MVGVVGGGGGGGGWIKYLFIYMFIGVLDIVVYFFVRVLGICLVVKKRFFFFLFVCKYV